MPSFAEETTIHGIAEFYRSSHGGRILWGLAFVGVLAFFLIGSLTLITDYVGRRSFTTTEFEDAVMPPFAITPPQTWLITKERLGHAGFEANDTQVEAVRYIYTQQGVNEQPFSCKPFDGDSQILSSAPTPAMIESVMTKIEALGGLKTFALKTVPEGINFFNFRAKTEPYYPDVPIKTLVAYHGIKYVFDTTNITDRYYGYEINVNSFESCSYEAFYVSVGTNSLKLDDVNMESQKLECGKKHKITLQLAKYKRHHFYCDKDLDNSPLGCVSNCWIEAVNRNPKSCIAYPGEIGGVDVNRICVKDAPNDGQSATISTEPSAESK